MSFYERLNALCKQNNTSVSVLLKVLNLSTGNTGSWKKGILPKGETLIQIADYLDISVDYLLGRDAQHGELPDDERALLKAYREKPENVKNAVKALLEIK